MIVLAVCSFICLFWEIDLISYFKQNRCTAMARGTRVFWDTCFYRFLADSSSNISRYFKPYQLCNSILYPIVSRCIENSIPWRKMMPKQKLLYLRSTWFLNNVFRYSVSSWRLIINISVMYRWLIIIFNPLTFCSLINLARKPAVHI